jgi:hypothetical protein
MEKQNLRLLRAPLTKEVKYAVTKRYESSSYPCSSNHFGWLHKRRHSGIAASARLQL